MATIVVTMNPAEYAAWAKKLAERFMPAMLKGIRSGAALCIPLMKSRSSHAIPASDRGHVGAMGVTGLYIDAWKSRSLSNGAMVTNDRPYSAVIEHGRRFAPVGAAGRNNLKLWAKRVLGVSSDSEAESVAFVIARALSGKGDKRHELRPRKVMTGALADMTKRVHDEIEVILEAVFKGEM